MGRNRVLSFIAQFSAPHRDSRTPTPASSPKSDTFRNSKPPLPKQDSSPDSIDSPAPSIPRDLGSEPPSASSSAATTPPTDGEYADSPTSLDHSPSSSPTGGSRRNSSRPLSMVQTYQPPVMAVTEQTLPELQPIFTLLNSHSNKLYQEGYFLKLDDQDIRGKPNPDRTWTECFAQLVGTVLSLWDAAELDAAGEDGEVLPKFINLTDASIKMIESLPTKTNDESPLQNILSISTAGRNRYLLHFNSHHSLIQWTSGIRLAMFEHSTLQEAYTGALVAGKGKGLNNINIIMERARQPVQEWVRVRFGAGVPWRRCYCVIEPPNEKEYQKAQKEFKKRSPYDRSHGPILKGEIRFFDTKKEAEKKKKHQRPIASITDAYSAYAIYPQAKELIDSSTLLKIEGDITIHSEPPSSTEGFVFIMPETHPAVSGFEMLMRTLFPTWDTFALYGRPGRLVASTLDTRSLMFAMPKHKGYGYLELMDVSGLILTDGSTSWSEREWRKRLKELTGQRLATMEDRAGSHSRSTSRNSKRLSFGAAPTSGSRPRVGFADDGGSVRSSRSLTVSRPAQAALRSGPERVKAFASDLASTPERVSSEDDSPLSPVRGPIVGNLDGIRRMETPEPVNAPPAFAHSAGSKPQQKPNPSPEMRRATNRLSNTTLSQLAKAGGFGPDAFSDDNHQHHLGNGSAGPGPRQADQRGLAVQPQTSINAMGMNANMNGSREVLTSPPGSYATRDGAMPPPPLRDPARKRSNSPLRGPAPNPTGNAPPSFRPGPHGGPPSGGRRTPPPGPNHYAAGGSPPVHRKPLPVRTTSLSRDQNHAASPISPQSPPSAFSSPGSGPRFGQLNQFASPPAPGQNQYRQQGQRAAEGGFDDASSTASPDYASTRRSSDTQESVDRPRAGVLKVVGDGGAGSSTPSDKEYDIPEINFGRTLNYSAPMIPGGKGPSKESQRAGPPSSGRKSPGIATAFSHARQQSDDTTFAFAAQFRRHALQWATPRSADLLVSGRPASQGTGAALAGNDPYKRPGSRGLLHSRNSSADLLASARPGSQGTNAVFSAGEASSYLSAREQEHVARVTGSPLIALAPNKGPSQTQAGLVGAIDARERERAQMRQGIGGQAVAQAIDQRHREHNRQAQRAAQVAYAQQQAQFNAQQSYGRPQTPGAMGRMMDGGAPSPYGPPQPRPQTPGSMGMMGPGGAPSQYGPPGQPRPQTPGSMGRMGPGGPAPYPPSIPGMNVRSMSPGPGMHFGQGPPQPRPQMMPHASSYGGGAPGPGGRNMGNMPPPRQGGGPMMPSPSVGYGMQQGGRPQSPAFHMPPPQGQYAPPGAPGGPRPGTPGRMHYQGQAF
ncbi:hypothetical protein NEMBOFW57_002278 [Staphylotrichum longicolle]|uniref:PH domain-containing protein n=1 Tax=Staphylotrichum longicolle TaxID=669026 RepID=A0AAD4F2Q0_9PEZI|nr:hypothetical protein NEMBOFW57_002278 [Staphylotrichum longicolle]